jgi:basic membrane protein A
MNDKHLKEDNNRMKKLLSLAMAAVMVVSLVACGSAPAPAPAASTPAATTPAVSAPAASTPAADDAFTVGAIYITSKNDSSGYTFAHHNGITTAMNELGMDAEKQLVIVDRVDDSDAAAIQSAIDTLIGAGCDMIIGISFGYLEVMNTAAEENPDVVFSHATGYLSNETNYNNYFGRIYQARYLAGIAAGLKSLELGNNNMGYVSAFGTQYAETCSGINAFALGAQSVNPDAVVYVKELGVWGDEINESAFAKELINSYNACVIAQHCDSAQPQIAAQDAGVFGCGYNSDMTPDAPAAHLTAPIWNWNVYYHTAIETAMTCGDAANFVTAMGGPAYYGGLAENFVDVSPVTENCAENTEEILAAVKELIISGQWDVFSGTKLSYTVDGGKVTIEQTAADLTANDGAVIVPAGGPSVDDGVICGSMNYYVAGVTEG